MNPRLRSTLLLAATLLVGIVLGAAGSRDIARLWQPAAPPAPGAGGPPRGAPPSGFVANMEQAIVPRDDAQRDAVRAILEATSARNRVQIQEANAALKARVDSMRVEIAPLLDSAQLTRLDEAMQMLQPIGPPRRGGSPPGGRRNGPRPDERGGPPPMRAPPS